MELFSCLLCLLLAWIVLRGLHSIRRTNTISLNHPPGPRPFPVIGNLFELGEKPHKSLAKLANIHGPIMTLKLGQITTIVISSPAIAQEVLQKHDLSFSSRTIPDAFRSHNHDQFSVAWLPVSKQWRTLRKICNSHIFTPQKLDANKDLRRKKVQELLADVQESCAGRAIDVGQAAFKASLNLLSNTIFSVNLAGPSSDTVKDFKELVGCMMEEGGKPNLADYFPALKKIDPQGIRHRLTIYFGKMIALFDDMIIQRLKLREEQNFVSSEDMLDVLLNICEQSPEEINRIHIKHLFLDLFAAGTDSTSITIEWAMTELLRNPDTLSKACKELEQNIGRGKHIEESDISRLPYLEAIIKETLRLHPPFPFLLPHKVEENVEICGCIVPKGAQVLVNAWAIGRDPTTWDNPNSFVPERFLDSDIDVKGQNFELIPFGAGRRICPGLPLAKRMVHQMLGSLINCFDWKLLDGVSAEDIDMEDKFGISLQKAHPLRAVPVPVPVPDV